MVIEPNHPSSRRENHPVMSKLTFLLTRKIISPKKPNNVEEIGLWRTSIAYVVVQYPARVPLAFL